MTLAVGWLFHPLGGLGYQFWSGIGSNFGYLAILAALWRKHNCHMQRCWRLQWRVDPAHGHPVCRRHHSNPASERLPRLG